jgi:hypothetical protein
VPTLSEHVKKARTAYTKCGYDLAAPLGEASSGGNGCFRKRGSLRSDERTEMPNRESTEARTPLTEDEVVDAVCRTLASDGYVIEQRALSTQHGYDIVARRGGVALIIEAKGAGSSKAGTARYGREFTANQVFDHVAKAVLKALRVVSADEARAGIALPDNASHRREVAQVMPALTEARVIVFWVDDNGGVRVDAPRGYAAR